MIWKVWKEIVSQIGSRRKIRQDECGSKRRARRIGVSVQDLEDGLTRKTQQHDGGDRNQDRI